MGCVGQRLPSWDQEGKCREAAQGWSAGQVKRIIQQLVPDLRLGTKCTVGPSFKRITLPRRWRGQRQPLLSRGGNKIVQSPSVSEGTNVKGLG
jgi:hypothetical protein